MYKGVTIVMRMQGGNTKKSYNNNTCVHQGSTLSPYFYTLIIDVLTYKHIYMEY